MNNQDMQNSGFQIWHNSDNYKSLLAEMRLIKNAEWLTVEILVKLLFTFETEKIRSQQKNHKSELRMVTQGIRLPLTQSLNLIAQSVFELASYVVAGSSKQAYNLINLVFHYEVC